jgi:hypothetical protein
MGFGDYSTAAKFKETIGGLVREFLELERPSERYGVVVGVSSYLDDNGQRVPSVAVRYIDSAGDFDVADVVQGGPIPAKIGQTVIIGGGRGSRRIVAALGPQDSWTGSDCLVRTGSLGATSVPSDGEFHAIEQHGFNYGDDDSDQYNGGTDLRLGVHSGLWLVCITASVSGGSLGGETYIAMEFQYGGPDFTASSSLNFDVGGGGVVANTSFFAAGYVRSEEDDGTDAIPTYSLSARATIGTPPNGNTANVTATVTATRVSAYV